MAAVLIVCPRSGASVSTGLSLDPEGLRALSPPSHAYEMFELRV
jgi:hypothetical protein